MSQPDPQQHAWGAWARVQENVAAAQAAQVAQQSAAQEEVRVHASWIDWGTAFKTAKPHVMQTSLFWNHYSEGNSAFCCLNAEVLSPDRQQRLWYRFLGDADITLKFDIAGGSDFPHFRLKLTHKPTNQIATLCFMAWTHKQAPGVAERRVSNFPDECYGEGYTFSTQLMDVEWKRLETYPPLVVERVDWERTERTYPLAVNWRVDENPIGINLNVDPEELSALHRGVFARFAYLKSNAVQFRLIVRGFGALQGSWDYFSAMPAPPLPSWWRYSTKTEPNQAIIEDFPPLSFGSPVFMHHCSRDANRNPLGEKRIDPMSKFDYYLDERHYEVVTLGSHFRQTATSEDANLTALFKVAQKAIQASMWESHHKNWLKGLLLAHNNGSLRHITPTPTVRPWLRNFQQLNYEQQLAFERACEEGPSLSHKMSIIQGPPGTGKTRVLGMIATNCVIQDRPFLLVAETQYAVSVCAQRITQDLLAVGDDLEGIWLMDRHGIESADIVTSTADSEEDSLLASPFDRIQQDINMSDNIRAKVIEILHEQSNPKPLSLPSDISSRLALYLQGEAMHLDEETVLRDIDLARRTIEQLNDGETEPDDFRRAYRRFDKAWREVQEFYIQRNARGLIMTAATALSPHLRAFQPHWVIVDEASELTESATVAVISRFAPSLCKVVLLGDPKQRFPFGLDELTEFYRTTTTSLMVRMIKTGVPYTMLQEQFRMHPHISATVSRLFYSGLLRDSPGVLYQNEHTIWRKFHELYLRPCEMRHSIFVHVKTKRLFRTKRTKSLVNPTHLAVIPAAIDAIKRAGARDEQIAVLTPYKGQLAMIKNLGLPNETVITIDAAQGKEYDFVLLDLVTPGAGYGLGFMSQTNRACVALSRARFGLVILGNQNMGGVQWPSEGSKIWDKVVTSHRDSRGLLRVNVQDQVVEALMGRHRIPGTLFEELEDRSASVRNRTRLYSTVIQF